MAGPFISLAALVKSCGTYPQHLPHHTNVSQVTLPDPGDSRNQGQNNTRQTAALPLCLLTPRCSPFCRIKQLRFARSCPALLCLSLTNLMCTFSGRQEGPKSKCWYRAFEVASLCQEEREKEMAGT